MGSAVEIQVTGNYKPGRVTTTVTDLTVPAPGLPIQIQRTYDSLVRSTSSDFGYGWSLGVNVQLDVSPLNDLTLTINGQRHTFYFTPYMTASTACRRKPSVLILTQRMARRPTDSIPWATGCPRA